PHVPEIPAKQQLTLTPALPSSIARRCSVSFATILSYLQASLKKDVIASHELGLGQVRLRLRSLSPVCIHNAASSPSFTLNCSHTHDHLTQFSRPATMLGKLFHYAADAILISAVLAGIKRSTGLTVASDKIESKDVRSAVDQYLGIGEWVVDQGIMFMSNSKYFHRKR
ncbi:MAG: hypothetical protein JOS17DRAFT_769455, partial [Linnemannia elongata]